jgi:hypothetical protein
MFQPLDQNSRMKIRALIVDDEQLARQRLNASFNPLHSRLASCEQYGQVAAGP